MDARSKGLRTPPLTTTGSWSTRVLLTWLETRAVSVISIWALAVTSTVCVVVPTSNWTSTRRVLPAATTTFPRTWALNPWLSTLT